MAELFDRRIDLTFYSSDGALLAEIKTPEIGPKPEIKVEGVMLNMQMSISSKVTVTNLERTLDVDSVAFIFADCYYGASALDITQHKVFMYNVLWADQSKQPPDRQVCFNCTTLGFSNDLASNKVTIKPQQDADGKLIPFTHKALAELFVLGYNKAIGKAVPAILASSMFLQGADYTALPEYATQKVELNEGDYTLYDLLDYLNTCVVDVEPTDNGTMRKYYPITCFVDDKKLRIVPNPSTKQRAYISTRQRELKYIISAFRRGPIIHVQMLFDPLVSQSTLLKLSSDAIYGKKTLGAIVALPGDKAEFYPVAGIEYCFSTNTENYMKLQGYTTWTN